MFDVFEEQKRVLGVFEEQKKMPLWQEQNG